MPFRREEVEFFCRLTDQHNQKHPLTAERKEEIRRLVEQIVEAHKLLEGSGVEGLSDLTAIALVVLLLQ